MDIRKPVTIPRPRFSLRTLLLLITLFALTIGYAQRRYRKHQVVESFKKHGAQVLFHDNWIPGWERVFGTTLNDVEAVDLSVRTTRRHYSDDLLEPIHRLDRLKRLSLSSKAVTAVGLHHLLRNKQLTELSISWADLDGTGIACLERLPNLEFLDVSNSKVAGELLRKCTTFPALETFVFSTDDQGIVPDDICALVQIKALPKGRIRLRGIDDETLKAYMSLDHSNAPGLKIADSSFTCAGIATLSPSIQKLEFERCRISADAFSLLDRDDRLLAFVDCEFAIATLSEHLGRDVTRMIARDITEPVRILDPNYPPSDTSKYSFTVPSPPMRRLARERGVNWKGIAGSGEDGRITREDILTTIREAPDAIKTHPVPSMALELDPCHFDILPRIEVRHPRADLSADLLRALPNLEELVCDSAMANEVLPLLEELQSSIKFSVKADDPERLWSAIERIPSLTGLEVQFRSGTMTCPRFTAEHRLEHLRLERSCEPDLEWFQEIGKLSRLERLSVRNKNPLSHELEPLRQLKHLREITIFHLQSEAVDTLKSLGFKIDTEVQVKNRWKFLRTIANGPTEQSTGRGSNKRP